MRKALITGLMAAVAAPEVVWAQQAPAPLVATDVTPVEAGPGPGPQPGDVAPAPPPAAPGKKSKKQKFDAAGTAGGAAGAMLAKGAGVAVAGPVGGIAAGMVGGRLGRATVGLVKKVVGADDKKDRAKAAPDAAADAYSGGPQPVGLAEFTPPAEPPPEPVGEETPS